MALLRTIFIGSEKGGNQIAINEYRISKGSKDYSSIYIVHVYLYKVYYANFQNYSSQKSKELLLLLHSLLLFHFPCRNSFWEKKMLLANNTSIYFDLFQTLMLHQPSLK